MTRSKRIQRIFQGVGRIALASGTDHAPTFKRINAALTGLYKIGRLDVLLAVRDGVHAPLVVMHYYERGQLDKLPTTETAAGLAVAFRTFAETHQASTAYRADLMTSVRRVERVTTKATAVSDTAKVLRSLKKGMSDTPVAFNKLRAHLLAFASEIQGKYSPLWNEIAGVNRYKKADVPARGKLRRPLTVSELDAVCEAFKDWPVYGGRRGAANKGREKTVKSTIRAAGLVAMTRTLATTGMRPKEYWQREKSRWQDRGTYVWVDGSKTAAAKRPTFRLSTPVLPNCGEQFYREQFAAACKKALGVELDVYSLRRTFFAWCESARVEQSRARAYGGHGARNVDEIYLQTHVLPFVEQDAARVLAWIEEERARNKSTRFLTLSVGAQNGPASLSDTRP